MDKIVILLEQEWGEAPIFIGSLIIPSNLDLNVELEIYRRAELYRKQSFEQWLLSHGAKKATEKEVIEFYY